MTTSCGVCDRALEHGYLCPGDTLALAKRLDRLPALSGRLSASLAPTVRAPAERVSTGRFGPSSPVNDAALELWYGGMACVLERWRSDIQSWKGWGEPAIEGGVERRVLVATRWICMSLEWIAAEYPSAGDLAREVKELEGAASSILGEGEDRGRRIGQCVAIDPSGVICGAVLRHRTGETRIVCPWCTCVYGPDDFLMLRHFQPHEAA
ncbi:hypothetical protein ABZ890_08245 [Streptomyces sp. NPDC046984]|uniref:hypothetical protein n=1 Tax=Streptomyces sp. NPDC046984 TaxID=3155138 RepID=UPI0033FDA3AD